MQQSLERELTSNEKKKMEAKTWCGPKDHNLPLKKFHQVHTKEWNEYLLRSVFQKNFFQDQKVLNVGGGNGQEAEFILSSGVKSVVLADIAPGQLSSAKLRIDQHSIKNLSLLLCDAEILPIADKQFGIGLIFFALHHFPRHRDAVNELCRTSENVIIIDIMDCGLTRFFNKFGLFLKEGGLMVNRVKENDIRQCLAENNLTFSIQFFFMPPYYGNSRVLMQGICIAETIINFLISRNSHAARFFGNVAIIESVA